MGLGGSCHIRIFGLDLMIFALMPIKRHKTLALNQIPNHVEYISSKREVTKLLEISQKIANFIKALPPWASVCTKTINYCKKQQTKYYSSNYSNNDTNIWI